MLLPTLLLAAAVSLPATPADIPPLFVEMLRRDDDGRFSHDRLGYHHDVDGSEWKALNGILEAYDCISVPSYTSTIAVDGNKARVEVTIENAFGFRMGVTRAHGWLPRRWIIEAVQTDEGWALDTINSGERLAATEVLAAEPSKRRELLEQHLQTLDARVLMWNLGEMSRADRQRGQSVTQVLVDAATDLQDQKLQTLAYFAISTWHRYARNPKEMQHFADEALAAAKRSEHDDSLLIGLFASAVAAGHNGEPDKEYALLLQAAALMEKVDEPGLALGAQYNAATIDLHRGRLIEALHLAQQNAEMSRRFGSLAGEAYALFILAAVHAELRNMETALEINRRVVAILRQQKNRRMEAAALANMGVDYASLGDFENAIAATQQAIDIEKDAPWATGSGLRESHLMLGEVLLSAGRYDEAERALEAARTPPDEQFFPRREISRLVAASELKRLKGDAEGALALAREAVKILATAEEVPNDAVTFNPWAGKNAEARALLALGRKSEAEAAFRAGIAIVEELRRSFTAPEGASVGFMVGKTDVHRQLANFLVENGRAAEALELTSAVKARTLLEAVQHGRVDPFEGISEEKRKQYDALNERIETLNVELLDAKGDKRAAVEAKLITARMDLETFELTLFAEHRPMRVTATQRPPADPASLADANTAIVEYLTGEHTTLAFVVVRGKPIVAKKLGVNRRTMEDLIARYVRKLERRDLTHVADASLLYAELLQPLEADLGGAKVLCIIPDGALWNLPFQALMTADKRYVVESRAVFYAPSLAALQLARSRGHARKPQSVVAIGNPTVSARTETVMRAVYRDAAALGDLPDAEEEARQVGRMYPSSRVLTGADAREEKVKEASAAADVLHFATHALVSDSQPMYSSIVLSAGAAEDGLLEAREILNRDLSADLVVLSACSTARGEINPGEGLVGLTWSFLIAGASSTVAAQWPVLSKSTAELMVAFHRNLTAGIGKAEALRQAQLSVMKRPGYEHPFYWSPFVLIGAN